MIDWRIIQERLGVAADGEPGRVTYGSLFGFVAGRPLDRQLLSLGNAAAIHLRKYDMLTAPRLSWMLAETNNETGGYRRFHENLNYSATRLVQVWPKHFTRATAPQYANQPEKIANKAYGGRMGNKDPGDGWAYRGRGMLQLTGRGNYERFDRLLGIGLDLDPDIAATPALSLQIACEFYRVNEVMERVDRYDLPGARLITNGGAHGLPEVTKAYHKVMGLLV
jgi:putative chitinase